MVDASSLSSGIGEFGRLARSPAVSVYPHLASVRMIRLGYVESSEPWFGTCSKYVRIKLIV